MYQTENNLAQNFKNRIENHFNIQKLKAKKELELIKKKKKEALELNPCKQYKTYLESYLQLSNIPLSNSVYFTAEELKYDIPSGEYHPTDLNSGQIQECETKIDRICKTTTTQKEANSNCTEYIASGADGVVYKCKDTTVLKVFYDTTSNSAQREIEFYNKLSGTYEEGDVKKHIIEIVELTNASSTNASSTNASSTNSSSTNSSSKNASSTNSSSTNSSSKKSSSIRMKKCQNCSLRNFLDTEYHSLTSINKKDISEKICESVQYLHNFLNYLHNDIKPENICIEFLKKEEITITRILLFDFGASCEKENTKASPYTLGYAHYNIMDGKSPTIHTDLWSVVCVIYEIFHYNRLFPVYSSTIGQHVMEMSKYNLVEIKIKFINDIILELTQQDTQQENQRDLFLHKFTKGGTGSLSLYSNYNRYTTSKEKYENYRKKSPRQKAAMKRIYKKYRDNYFVYVQKKSDKVRL